MKKYIPSTLVVLASIVIAGLLLDEAGKGTFGGLFQAGAKKVTRGFGV